MKLALLLLRGNANLNVKNFKIGQTPLHYAVDLGCVKIAELMISYDASPLIRDKCNKSPMDLATVPEIQRVLVEPPKKLPESPARPSVHNVETEEEAEGIKVPEIPTPRELAESPLHKG